MANKNYIMVLAGIFRVVKRMFGTGKHQLISSKIALDKLHGFYAHTNLGEMTYLKRSSNSGLQKLHSLYTKNIFGWCNIHNHFRFPSTKK